MLKRNKKPKKPRIYSLKVLDILRLVGVSVAAGAGVTLVNPQLGWVCVGGFIVYMFYEFATRLQAEKEEKEVEE